MFFIEKQSKFDICSIQFLLLSFQMTMNTTIASAIAGVISRLLMYPLDLAKTKVQIQQNRMDNFKQLKPGLILSIIKETFKKQGLKGVYRGLTISMFGTVPGFCLYMTTYQVSKQKLLQLQFFKEKTGTVYLLSGLIAQIVSCIFFLPVDVIKQRLQVQSQLNSFWYKNARDAANQIMNKQGIRGLYKAYGATIAFFGPFSALYFYFYQKFKIKFCVDPSKPSFNQSLLLSGLAGSIAGYVVTPLELSKIRMQVQRAQSSQRFKYNNFMHGLFKIFREEGILALYRGGMVRVMFSAPMTAISMSLTQAIKLRLN